MDSNFLLKATFADGSTTECGRQCYLGLLADPASCLFCGGISFGLGRGAAEANARRHGDDWIRWLVQGTRPVTRVERAAAARQDDALFGLEDLLEDLGEASRSRPQGWDGDGWDALPGWPPAARHPVLPQQPSLFDDVLPLARDAA
jgi:hypothetical protein